MNDRELVELLRKCHRDELEPLAKILGIKTQGMALGTLATAIDLRVRRAATSELWTILRLGDPPPYGEVLRSVGLRMGLDLPKYPPTAELAIVRHQVRHGWAELTAEERQRQWTELAPPEVLGGPPSAPVDPELMIATLERRHPQTMGYHLARLVTNPPVPMPGCLLILWLARPRDDLVVPAVVEICRLRTTMRHRVTVGIVGSPSSGKDAALGAIFGLSTGNVDPVAGSTRQVEIRRLPGSTALFVVNTPGMGDVIEAVTEEARQVLDHIDVYVYLVNAQGGVQAREKADYEACRRRGRPVLAVVNKVDTLRPDDRDRFLEDCRQKLKVSAEDLLPAAFDPLPQLSETPIGVDAIRAWIERRLGELGKDREELPWNHLSPA
jgi:GTP-binding protein EngB required for normal cell division